MSLEEAGELITRDRSIFEKNPGTKETGLVLYKAPLKASYVPQHSAHVTGLTSSYVGEYGVDRVEYYTDTEYNSTTKSWESVTRSRVVTDWYDTEGTMPYCDYPFGTTRTQIYAGFRYPRNYIETVLAKGDVTQIGPLTTEMVKDRLVEPHTMTEGLAQEKIVHRLYTMEKERAEKHILRSHRRADHSRVRRLDVHVERCEMRLRSYHLPAFIYEFGGGGAGVSLFKIVDGYSGVVSGDRIYSPMKSFLASSMVGILMSPLLPFMMPGLSVGIPLMIGRALIGGVLTGTPAGVWARFQHIRKATRAVEANRDDEKRNQNFEPTTDDVARRRDAETFNAQSQPGPDHEPGEPQHEFHNFEDVTLAEKLTLLGLDPTSASTLTKEDIKRAYHHQIQKWHPDVYRGDKVVATNMTIQLNRAYARLSEVDQKS